MCTFMVNNGTAGLVLLLDAYEAFEFGFFLLFQKLIDKGMCPLVVRLLLTPHVYKSETSLSCQFHIVVPY